MKLITDTAMIDVPDYALDRIASLLENSPEGSLGFWIAGQLSVERDGEPMNPDPSYGHQRMWIPATQIVTLVYDRPLHPDPDRIKDLPNVVFV